MSEFLETLKESVAMACQSVSSLPYQIYYELYSYIKAYSLSSFELLATSTDYDLVQQMINKPFIQDANLFLSTTFLFMPREEGNDIGLDG